MKKIVFILFALVMSSSFYAQAEILIELSDKKLPIFNMPLLKESEFLYFIEDDPINNIKYVAHKSCFTFNIIGLTKNKKQLFNESDIKNLIETAQDYADIFCPTTNKISFTISSGLDLEPSQILFKTSMIRQDKWIEEKELRKNYTLEKEIEKTNKIKTELSNKTQNQRLAYLLNTEELSNMPNASMDAFLNGTQEINAMVLVNSIENNFATSSHPVKSKIYGIPEKVGFYLISGTLSSKKGNDELFQNTIHVKEYIACRKKGCSDLYDINYIITRGNR